MSNLLQNLANGAQIVSMVWMALLGGKTIFDIAKARKKQPARNIFSWPLIFNLFTIVAILVSLIVNVTLTTYIANLPKGQLSGSAPSRAASPNSPKTSAGTPITGTPIVPGPLITPAATSPSGGRSINQQLPCTNATCNPDLAISLISSNVDVQKKLTTLMLIATNNGRSQLTDYGSGSAITLQSALDSQAYTGYEGTSDHPFSISLGPGEQSEQNIEFTFVPYQNVRYKLYIEVSLDDGSNSNINFDPMTLTF